METTKKPLDWSDWKSENFLSVNDDKGKELFYEMSKCKTLKEFEEKYGKKDSKQTS